MKPIPVSTPETRLMANSSLLSLRTGTPHQSTHTLRFLETDLFPVQLCRLGLMAEFHPK